MRSLHSVILATCAHLASAQAEYAGGCPESQIIRNGFDVTYWQYSLYSQAGFLPNGSMNPTFYQGGYKNVLLTDQVQGLTDINFYSLEPEGPALEYGDVYGRQTTVTNFTLEFVGYYKAPQDGEYTLHLSADDNVSLQFGRGNSCCGSFDSNLIVDRFETGTSGVSYEYGIENIDGATFRTSNFTTVLSKGIYYPIKMVYFNAIGPRALLTTMVEPDGTNNTLWAQDVYQMNVTQCPLIVSEPWTGTFTTDTTTTLSAPSSTTTEIIVRTPGGSGTETTTTVPWTGSSTQSRTSTGLYTTTADGSTHTRIVTTYWVDTPTATPTAPAIASTMTFPWAGTDVSAHTRIEPYTFNGETGIITRVWVLTPATSTTATTLTPSEPSFYYYTPTGPDTTTLGAYTATGVETTVDVIEIPTAPRSATTVRQPWSGTFKRTFSTEIGPYTITSDGLRMTGEATTFFVETPALKTITTEWTGTTTKTATVQQAHTVTSDGQTLAYSSKVVLVETPTSTLSTTTDSWSGTFTSTYTTETAITVTDVSTETSSYVVIKNPTANLSTTTEPRSVSTTSTFTTETPITATSGTLVYTSLSSIVETPSSIVSISIPSDEVKDTPTPLDLDTTEPWTGSKTSTFTTETSVTETAGNLTIATTSSIVVKTSSANLSTTTEPRSGSFTSTFTTETPVIVTSDTTVSTKPSSINVLGTPTGNLSTTTEPWNGTFTSTFTSETPVTGTIGTSLYTSLSSIVETPSSILSISIPSDEVKDTPTPLDLDTTEPWTGSKTSTFTTETSVTKTAGNLTIATASSIVVKTSSANLSTTSEPRSGSFTSSFTTETPVIETSDTTVSTKPGSINVIETPTGNLSTTTEPWNGTFISTFTSETPVTGTSGTSLYTSLSSIVETPSSIVSISIPSDEVKDTPTPLDLDTTEPWTGSTTSTFTTETSVTKTVENPTFATASSTVVVENPPTANLSTATVPWRGTFTMTNTTTRLVTESSGTDTHVIPTSIVLVETPSTNMRTVTVPWTGAFNSASMTETKAIMTSGISVFTASENIVRKETPSGSASGWSSPIWLNTIPVETETSTWGKSFSSTYSTASINSANKTIHSVVVEVPSCTECAGNQLSKFWPNQPSGDPTASSDLRAPPSQTTYPPNGNTAEGGTYTATREVTSTTVESCTLEKCYPMSTANQGSEILASSQGGERPSPSSTDYIPGPLNSQPAQPSAFSSNQESCFSCSTDTYSANPSGSPNEPFNDSRGSSSSLTGSTPYTPHENPAGEQSNHKPVETSDSSNHPINSSGSSASFKGVSENSSRPTSSGTIVVGQTPETTSMVSVAVANKGSYLSRCKASSVIFGLLMLMLI